MFTDIGIIEKKALNEWGSTLGEKAAMAVIRYALLSFPVSMPVVWAQAQTASTDAVVLEQIVITAEKHVESVDDMPTSVTDVADGPQGTLFACNATGGAIQILSKDLTFTRSGDSSFSYRNYNDQVAKAFLRNQLAASINILISHRGH